MTFDSDLLDLSDCPTCGVRVVVTVYEATSSTPGLSVRCGEGCDFSYEADLRNICVTGEQ